MKTKLFLFLMIALATLTQCKKDGDDDNDGDLTTDIVGRYDEVTDDLSIIVNRVDDNTVSITIDDRGFTYAFTDVTMQSKTSFTLNQYTRSGNLSGVFSYLDTYSGNGTNSSNNISINVQRNRNFDDASIPDENITISFIATKTN